MQFCFRTGSKHARQNSPPLVYLSSPSLFCSREIYTKAPPALGGRPPAYPKLVAVARPFCCKMAECCSAGVLVLLGHSPAPNCSTPTVRLQAQRRCRTRGLTTPPLCCR